MSISAPSYYKQLHFLFYLRYEVFVDRNNSCWSCEELVKALRNKERQIVLNVFIRYWTVYSLARLCYINSTSNSNSHQYYNNRPVNWEQNWWNYRYRERLRSCGRGNDPAVNSTGRLGNSISWCQSKTSTSGWQDYRGVFKNAVAYWPYA
jgi:hypothetical protein